jgi:hypothetical protein
MQIEPHIRLKFTAPPPDTRTHDSLLDVFTSTEAVRTLAALRELLNYPGDLFQHMGDWGEIYHIPGSLDYALKPQRKIPSSTSSMWMSGARKMPAWRIAQAYILIESFALELEQAALSAELPETGPVRRSLKRAKRFTEFFTKDPDIRPWLNPLRRVMAAWLKSVAHISEYHADRAAWYESLFHDQLWWKATDAKETP